MMSRLEEIRKRYEDDREIATYAVITLTIRDYDWLIEQAYQLENLKDAFDDLDSDYIDLVKQNQRYREAIKGAIGKFNYDHHQEGMAELLNVLEGES